MRDLTPARETLDPIEIASRDEIAALQLARLKATLAHAHANVPFYRDRLDEAGLHPDDVTSLEDLERVPFTTKADLREHYPFGLFAVPRERVARVHASSGTTGKPTVVGYTRADIEVWADLVARSLRAAGTRAGDVVHVAYGYGLFTGGLVFTLADTAFAFACNGHNRPAVAQHNTITYVVPARLGDTLVAEAEERSLSGRSGLYDVRVAREADDETIALFRGCCRVVGDHVFEEL